MQPETLDVAFRGGLTSLWIVLATLICLSRIRREAQIVFVCLATTSLARVWGNLPPGLELPNTQILRLFSVPSPFFATWFILTIFLDERRFVGLWLGSAAALSASLVFSTSFPHIVPFQRGYATLHFIALLALVLYSGRDDLQTARRRMRPAVSGLLLLYFVGTALTSTPMRGSQSAEAALGQSSLYFVIITSFAIWALKANISHWPGEIDPTPQLDRVRAKRTSEDAVLIARIDKAMNDGIWQEEGLTVGALAQKVGAPEHQVRRTINQVLGHRNFSRFINRARIDAAKTRLQDPNAANVTILQIAYDVGFSSLGPFNRAFRDATGCSPSDFRRDTQQDTP